MINIVAYMLQANGASRRIAAAHASGDASTVPLGDCGACDDRVRSGSSRPASEAAAAASIGARTARTSRGSRLQAR